MLFCCFSVLLALRLPRLGKREANLNAFPTFVRFVFVYCLFPLSSWSLGRAAACDCGIPWIFLLPFFFFFYIYILV